MTGSLLFSTQKGAENEWKTALMGPMP